MRAARKTGLFEKVHRRGELGLVNRDVPRAFFSGRLVAANAGVEQRGHHQIGLSLLKPGVERGLLVAPCEKEDRRQNHYC